MTSSKKRSETILSPNFMQSAEMGSKSKKERAAWMWNPRSIRFRAFVVVLFVSLSPLLLIFSSHLFENGALERMRNRTAKASLTACNLRSDEGKLEKTFPRLRSISHQNSVWMRIVINEKIIFDQDDDSEDLQALQDVFYGADGAPNIRDVDAAKEPLPKREFASTDGEIHCESLKQDLLVICESVRRCHVAGVGSLVHTTASTRRSIRALYDMRYQMLKLTVWLLPFAIFLSLWLGWRVVRPIERLAQNLDDVRRGNAPADEIALTRLDEVGELSRAAASAFLELEKQRLQNEIFVADLVHEFKSPVAAILSATDSLAAGDDERSQRIARILSQSGERLDVLLSEFLSLARAESGFVNEEWQSIQLRALLENILAEDAFSNTGVQLVDAEIRGVPFRLESALRSLLENALSFSDEPISITMVRSEHEVTVQIRDFGPGIADENLPRVFERFFTTRGEKQGTGLGLALVSAVILAHHGEVRAENANDGGARFSIHLPLA
ncbi:MAG: HAMP domain-containing protein [Deltaproteobacteria bacterium]|nr:HAMP domain-containing protein [Deltaproteobacteria bacterium]